MELLDTVKARWQGLQAREQQVLRLGAVIFGLLLVYLFIIDPVYSGRDEAEQRLQATRQAFAVVQQQASDLKASPAGAGTPGSGSLLTKVESSAQAEGLRGALKRLQPGGNDQIQVSLEGASYQQVMKWLGKLRSEGIRAQRVDIQVDRQSDLLQAQLVLVR